MACNHHSPNDGNKLIEISYELLYSTLPNASLDPVTEKPGLQITYIHQASMIVAYWKVTLSSMGTNLDFAGWSIWTTTATNRLGQNPFTCTSSKRGCYCWAKSSSERNWIHYTWSHKTPIWVPTGRKGASVKKALAGNEEIAKVLYDTLKNQKQQRCATNFFGNSSGHRLKAASH